MSFSDSIKTCFQKYIEFSGRASRSEYWWFALFILVVSVALSVVAIVLPLLSFLEWIFALAVLLPSLAVGARRLHDTNRTGWWQLLHLAPIVGVVLIVVAAVILFLSVWDSWQADADEVAGGIAVVVLIIGIVAVVVPEILLLIFLVSPGTAGPNRYGPDPLQQQTGISGFRTQGHPYASPPPDGDFTSPGLDSQPSHSPQSREAGQRRYCTQCGTNLAPDTRFCTECGTAA